MFYVQVSFVVDDDDEIIIIVVVITVAVAIVCIEACDSNKLIYTTFMSCFFFLSRITR